jgi:transcriptional regulator
MQADKVTGDWLQGALDLLVLQTLRRGSLHGYAISRLIEQRSAELFTIKQGSLYPSLHRLEQRGLVRGRWAETETNRRARFYALTAAGEAELERETSGWQQFAKAVNLVLAAG